MPRTDSRPRSQGFRPRVGVAVPLLLCLLFAAAAAAFAQSDPLPSWNDGPAKRAILDFVRATTEQSSPAYVAPTERLAVFDQDGTTWVEQPMYTSILYALDRLREKVDAKPELRDAAPYKSVLAAAAKRPYDLSGRDIAAAIEATSGLTVDAYAANARQWLETTRDGRWGRRYTELVYQPMLEVMRLLRAHGYKTCFATGGQQDFLRVYAEAVYGVVPGQVIGTISAVEYGYGPDGRPLLTGQPRLLLIDDGPGKPEGIHMVLGRRPTAAFGNSIGDREMLEYTQAGSGARLMMLVRHDDAKREYAYGPDTAVGTFSDALMREARKKGWIVISMKKDWKRIFAWEK